MRILYWFRNDLRLYDNPALRAAVEAGHEVLPVYVLDELWLERDRWGFRRTGPWRLRFLLESLQDLKEQLREMGSDLLVVRGRSVEVLPQLAGKYECEVVYASKEYTPWEVRMEERLREKLPLHLYHASALVHPEDVTFAIDDLPEVFTAFRKKVEKYSRVREPLEAPEAISSPDLPDRPLPEAEEIWGAPLPEADERGVLAFRGGTKAAYKRLDHYFWDTDRVEIYKKTRNGLIGADYSTKFSPWLANGSISPRAIYYDLEDYEQQRTKNQSTYWVKFELLWRDYFKYVAMKHGARLFQQGGILQRDKSWRDNHKNFRKWALGQTGDRFVDANMRELLYTGFMSNRGRQNVASFLVHRYKEDWRKGAAWFESLLIDYDPASNYGNWAYNSGVGNDPRDRVFNTDSQASRYDGEGEYRALWLDREAPLEPEEMLQRVGGVE